MRPAAFDYFSAGTVDEALYFLKKYGKETKILAGGMSLAPVMKMRFFSPRYILDIGRLADLKYIRQSGGSIAIGAMTTHHEIEASDVLRTDVPLMCDAASQLGDPQVRNRGTIGGSLVNADPAGDWGSVMIALNAKIRLDRARSHRFVDASRFFAGPMQSSARPGELLTEIVVPVPPARSGGAYVKLKRREGDLATVAAAAQLTCDGEGTCTYAGIALTNAAPTNIRARRAENILLNRKLDTGSIARASSAAAAGLFPQGDAVRGTSEYKKDMVRVLTHRALLLAAERAGVKLR